MFYPKTLHLEHWATWKSVDVDLSYEGMTFLRGQSKDASGNPNMAGKSTLMNSMYALIHGDHQLAVRKRSLKSITNDDTKITLSGRIDKKRVDLSLDGGRFAVAINKQDQEIHKQPTARQMISNQIGIPAELWSSTIHINGIDSNPLIRGSGAQRCQFLENAFDLNQWGVHHDKVGEALSSMKRAAADLEEARAALDALPKHDKPQTIKESIKDLEQRLESLNDKARKLERNIASLETLPNPPEREAKHYENVVEILEKKLSRIEKLRTAYNDYVRKLERYEAYAKRKSKLDADAKTYSGPSATKIQRTLDTTNDAIKECDAYARQLPLVKEWRRLAVSIADAHGIEYSDLNELRALSSAWIAALKPGAKNCPVCGSKFKGTIDESTLRDLRSAQQRLPTKIVKPTEDLKELLAKRKRLGDALRDAKIAERAKSDLDDLDVVKKPDEVDAVKDDAANIADRLSRAKILFERASAWDKAGLHPKMLDKLADMRVHLTKLSRKRKSLADDVSALREQLSQAMLSEQKSKDLQAKIVKLEKEVELQPIYKALQAAYSPNGIRLTCLYEILESLVANLNSGSYTLRDRIVYGYKLSKNRDLTLTASNIHKTYDVRFLSGAESRFFCINLLLTLLPLLPSHKRASILILDEIEANMSSDSMKILAQEYIPRLREVVPSVWIVTPKTKQEFSVPDARELIAVKKNGVSKLVEV